jgi:hypothetical protein
VRVSHHRLKLYFTLNGGLCRALAAVTHDSIMTPFDTVKQRMQLGYYNNIVHCVKNIVKYEGRGLAAVTRAWPYLCLFFTRRCQCVI